jgi:FixJ family two-component response regulator
MTARPTVFVVDADASVRESLELLIGRSGWQPKAFASAKEFLAHPRVPAPCCMVLDVALPGLSGLDLQKLVADRTDMPIIFLTGSSDVAMTVQAMKAGAVEFLTKPFRDQDLLDAVGVALEKDRSRRANELRLAELRSRFDTLTARERQVLLLVIAGRLNKQIAGELGVSEMTVKMHRRPVMRKMQAMGLAQLVRLADQLGLGSPLAP